MLLPAGVLPASVSETKVKVEAVGSLIRAGFDPEQSCLAVGLDPIKHSGLFPVTVQSEANLEEDVDGSGDTAPLQLARGFRSLGEAVG